MARHVRAPGLAPAASNASAISVCPSRGSIMDSDRIPLRSACLPNWSFPPQWPYEVTHSPFFWIEVLPWALSAFAVLAWETTPADIVPAGVLARRKRELCNAWTQQRRAQWASEGSAACFSCKRKN